MKTTYGPIEIDLTRDSRLTPEALVAMQSGYMLDDEVSPQQSFARAAVAFSGGDFALAQRMYDYVSQGWMMYASPILSNAPRIGEKAKALPISCFLTAIYDNLPSIIQHQEEFSATKQPSLQTGDITYGYI